VAGFDVRGGERFLFRREPLTFLGRVRGLLARHAVASASAGAPGTTSAPQRSHRIARTVCVTISLPRILNTQRLPSRSASLFPQRQRTSVIAAAPIGVA